MTSPSKDLQLIRTDLRFMRLHVQHGLSTAELLVEGERLRTVLRELRERFSAAWGETIGVVEGELVQELEERKLEQEEPPRCR